MVVGLDELTSAIPAYGTWPGVAAISRAFVKNLATSGLEKLSIVPITYSGGWITIGERSARCQWTDSEDASESK